MSLADLDDDDTGKIAALAREKPSSDPARDIQALRIAVLAHEQQDARRWRIALAIATFCLASAGTVAAEAWTSHASDAADAARLEDVRARCVRIEATLDRLMERAER